MINRVASVPDGNNVYAILAVHGLAKVGKAARRACGPEAVSLYRSGYDGTDTLRIRTASADFETTHLGDDEYLLSGGVGGFVGEVKAFVCRLSESLAAEGVTHQFEVYDDEGELLLLVPEPTGGTPSG